MLAIVSEDFSFAPDLYRGTAGYYDRFRLRYPPELIADLLRRAAPSGRGRLLDLACGTGQLAFALCDRFASVWAVDQEPDMVEVVRAKAAALANGRHVQPVVASAEELAAEPGSVELAVIGNAFHRLRRGPVARLLSGWLQAGGRVALCWSDGPWSGSKEWQLAFASLVSRWQEALAAGRVPANWDAPRREQPDVEVLAGAGLEFVGRYEFPAPHTWTVAELAGWVRSTSTLPPSVLGERGAAFDAQLTAALSPYQPLTQTVGFAYELARKPAGPAGSEHS